MSQVFDVIILGNGILGLFSAESILKEYPGTRIAIIGPESNSFGASIAAGAMHAVYAEIEGSFEHSSKEQKFFELGLSTRGSWSDWLNNHVTDAIKTSDNTILYAKKHGTVFERENYEAAVKQGKLDNCVEELGASELNAIFHGDLPANQFDAVRIHGEFSLNPVKTFVTLSRNIKKLGGTFIDARALSVKLNDSDLYQISLDNEEAMFSNRLIVTAGAGTSNILNNLFSSVEIIKGVGTAFILQTPSNTKFDITEVIRTPNRGGAQCGLHCVPYGEKNQYYIGAGNYLSDRLHPLHRAETLRYLIDLSEAEMFGRHAIYGSTINPLIGYRPRSIDGLPLIGQPKNFKNLFVATGTNRLGLTWAPAISEEILRWLSPSYVPDAFVGWEPDRSPVSWGSPKDASRYFSESRISNLVEHKLLDPCDEVLISSKRLELERLAEIYNSEIIKRLGLPSEFIVDPDLYSVLMVSDE